MAYIDQSQTKREIDDAIRGNTTSNLAPTKVSDDVQLVLNVNPKDYRRCNIVKFREDTNSTGGVIYTTPTDRDFYLVAAQLELIKDATSTSTISQITSTIDGAAIKILTIPSLTLTAQTSSKTISFPNAVKLDRGVTIGSSNGTNVANIKLHSLIYGYLVDP